jgi:RNA polymerase sigma-70 factor (ECF subfamily)
MNQTSPERNLTEADLVRLAQRGSQEAWTELVGLHQQAVFRLAYLHLGDADEAADAAQDCFVRAFRSLGRFDLERPLRPWLLRIVSNLALNRRRSVGRYWAALQRTAREQPADEPSPVAGSERRGEAKELWLAVQKLPDKMQTILYLRYFLELSVDETASALDVPVGTVKSQTHRALAKMQDVIREEFPALKEEWT